MDHKVDLLQSILSDTQYCLTDVGSDGGLKIPFGIFESLSQDSFIPVCFEPREDFQYTSFSDFCNSSVSFHDSHQSLNIPFLLGAREELVDFHITKKSQCSSCLIPDYTNLSLFHDLDRFKIVNSVKLPQTTLDHVFSSIDHIPNFIKIDAQGYDYQVLLGSTRVISQHKPWVMIEMNTIPFYKNQASVADISTFFANHNYHIVQIFPCYHKISGPNSTGILSFFDALWAPCSDSLISNSHRTSYLLNQVLFNLAFTGVTREIILTMNSDIRSSYSRYANAVNSGQLVLSDSWIV